MGVGVGKAPAGRSCARARRP